IQQSRPLRGQAAFMTFGRVSALGGMSAQCSAYFAPCRTQRVRTSTLAGLRRFPAFLGGMRSVSSSSLIRATRLLESGSPGTMAASPLLSGLTAASRWSSRSPLARFASSEPWQAKQFFDRIGRTSRLKSTGLAVLASGLAAFGSPAGLGLAAGSAPTSRTHPSTISPVGLLAGCNIRLIDPTPFPRRGRRSLAGRVSLGAVPAGRPSPHGTGLYRIHSDATRLCYSRVNPRESRRIALIVASSE